MEDSIDLDNTKGLGKYEMLAQVFDDPIEAEKPKKKQSSIKKYFCSVEKVPAFSVPANPMHIGTNEAIPWGSLEINQKIPVSVTWMHSAKDFYVQTYLTNLKYEELERKIQRFFFENVSNSLEISSIKKNELCLVVFEKDRYFRAEIMGQCEKVKGNILVFFIDYGNCGSLPPSSLHDLPSELMEIPRLVYNCKWDIAIAEEYPISTINRIMEEELETIIPTVQLGPGQYIVALGSHISNAKFALSPFAEAQISPAKINKLIYRSIVLPKPKNVQVTEDSKLTEEETEAQEN